MHDTAPSAAVEAALQDAERLYDRYIALASLAEAQALRELASETVSDSRPDEAPEPPPAGLVISAGSRDLAFH
ncbi:MAG: hypothetical protein QY307_04835 [Acidimicrobiia bacterium]|nr:MAG: hypothetical protein QY307_04835 [Acidimicrobiia bacterium]